MKGIKMSAFPETRVNIIAVLGRWRRPSAIESVDDKMIEIWREQDLNPAQMAIRAIDIENHKYQETVQNAENARNRIHRINGTIHSLSRRSKALDDVVELMEREDRSDEIDGDTLEWMSQEIVDEIDTLRMERQGLCDFLKKIGSGC